MGLDANGNYVIDDNDIAGTSDMTQGQKKRPGWHSFLDGISNQGDFGGGGGRTGSVIGGLSSMAGTGGAAGRIGGLASKIGGFFL